MSIDPSCDLHTTLHLRALVQPGKRIEITSDELRDGESVEVILLLPKRGGISSRSVVDYLDSLPPGPRSYPTWEEVEQSLQDERDSWDR